MQMRKGNLYIKACRKSGKQQFPASHVQIHFVFTGFAHRGGIPGVLLPDNQLSTRRQKKQQTRSRREQHKIGKKLKKFIVQASNGLFLVHFLWSRQNGAMLWTQYLLWTVRLSHGNTGDPKMPAGGHVSWKGALHCRHGFLPQKYWSMCSWGLVLHPRFVFFALFVCQTWHYFIKKALVMIKRHNMYNNST